jgi:hypothetical protein
MGRLAGGSVVVRAGHQRNVAATHDLNSNFVRTFEHS